MVKIRSLSSTSSCVSCADRKSRLSIPHVFITISAALTWTGSGNKMIGIGSDHGGYALKQAVIKHLEEKGYAVKDYGCYSEESCDYPVYAKAVANAVKDGEVKQGILICGTGIGISITANKIKGIRAALCSDTFSAHATREHNDANILAMGARVVGEGLALDIVDTFLETEFSNDERHIRRINMIED